MRFCILAVPMDNSSLLKKINDRNQGTLMQTLGIEFTDIGEDYLVARMPVSPEVHQPDGVLHGGATAALAETVGSSAAAVFCLPKNFLRRNHLIDSMLLMQYLQYLAHYKLVLKKEIF